MILPKFADSKWELHDRGPPLLFLDLAPRGPFIYSNFQPDLVASLTGVQALWVGRGNGERVGRLQWGLRSLCVLMSSEPSTTSGGPLPCAKDRQEGTCMQSRPARGSGWRLDGPRVPGPSWVPVNLDGCLPRALSYLGTLSWNSLQQAEPG